MGLVGDSVGANVGLAVGDDVGDAVGGRIPTHPTSTTRERSAPARHPIGTPSDDELTYTVHECLPTQRKCKALCAFGEWHGPTA